MSTDAIGITYHNAIGHSNPVFEHAWDMPKQLRSVYDRAMEALVERFPKEKPTQARLAQVAGIKQPSVNDWKEGYPTMDTAVRLSTALGVCVEWLLTERGPKRPAEAESSTLALLLSQLDDRQKARLARLAEVLKDDQ
jgi:transcriptional regulator with XRE-family HTH domain